MDDKDRPSLFVCELPKGYGLFSLNNAIKSVLGNEHALVKSEYVKRQDGTRIEGVSQILLQNVKCEFILLFNLACQGTVPT